LIEKQIAWIEKQLLAEQAVVQCPLKPNGSYPKRLKWTGDLIEIVELFYALHEAGCLGSINLKDLFAAVGEIFDCRVKNYYHLFWDIKNRVKGDRTAFLDRLKTALITKMEESEE
jgi:hypothetical protein